MASEANEVGDAAAGVGSMGNLAMVLVEVQEADRIEESSTGTYAIGLVLDKEI